jgi:predicted  nucleic acid-binding Zn-ribbon protein
MKAIDLTCRKCGIDLEVFNTGYEYMLFCPHCGARILKTQQKVLRLKISDVEIGDMVKAHLLDALSSANNGVRIVDLAGLAWERENYDGVVFYDNREADLFVLRHAVWIDKVMEYLTKIYGNGAAIATIKKQSNDSFLVSAFSVATERFLCGLCTSVDMNTVLTKTLRRKLAREIKTAEYYF